MQSAVVQGDVVQDAVGAVLKGVVMQGAVLPGSQFVLRARIDVYVRRCGPREVQ